MTEVLFYELDRQRLESALVSLLERSLERDWRAVVQATSRERIDALDSYLWTYREESFLPHGLAGGARQERQPVILCEGDENPNGASVRFFVDGAEIGDVSPYERAVYLFDGRDEEDRALARTRWRAAADAGHDVTYWKQDESGRWVKQG